MKLCCSFVALMYLLSCPLLCADDVLEASFGAKKIATGCAFTEGPAVDPHGNLFFSDGRNDRIMKRSRGGDVTVFRQPCGRANGLLFDHQGRLLMCQSSGEGGGRRVTRLEKDGLETVMAAEYNGKKFIAPNDLCIDRRGRVYFTDPYYGPPAEKSQPTSGVYRIDAPGQVKLVIDELQRPNGIVITPDNQFVYVSDRGTQKLHRYQVQNNGDLKPDGVLYEFSPDRGIDGMCLDVQGNVFGAAGQGKTTGLFVISPQGKLLLHKPMPEFSTNVTFGGEDMRDLYFTATTSVYHLRSLTAGAKLPPRIDLARDSEEKPQTVVLPPKARFHLFLLIGQSNMAGRGKIAPQDKKPHPRVLMLNKENRWEAAVAPLHFDKPKVVGVGLGRSFGIEVAKHNPEVTVGLIPCAVGGSPISSWMPGGFHPQTKTYPYDDALRRAKSALAMGTLKGILWHQGESDAKPDKAVVYEQKLHELIARLRKELFADQVPFIAGQMGQFAERPWTDARKKVDAAHQNLSKKIPRTAFVASTHLNHKGDEVHFDAASYRELGRRYAKVYLKMSAAGDK